MAENAQWALQSALFGALNTDPALMALFGNPLRLYDDVPEQPQFPFITFDRAIMRQINADVEGAFEHQMTIKLWSEYGGRREALEGLSALRNAIETSTLILNGHTLISIRITFADVFRIRSSSVFEVILNLRAVTEPII